MNMIGDEALKAMTLPSDFDIFSPFTTTKPLCSQVRAKSTAVPWAQTLCAISFSWCGKDQVEAAAVDVEDLAQVLPRSWPSTRCASPAGRAPGAVPARLVRRRGLPQHEVGRVALVGRATSTRAPAIISSRSRRDSWP
jgi:hypothetical protein